MGAQPRGRIRAIWKFFFKSKIRPSDWRLLFVWFTCYVVASMLPIWGGTLLHLLNNKSWPTLVSFSQDGEFVLLASSLLGSLFFTLFRDNREMDFGRFPGTSFIGPVGLLLIVTSAVVFSGAMSSSSSKPIDPKLMLNISIIVYSLSFALAVITLLIEVNVGREVLNSSNDDIRSLGDEVRGIRQSGG